MNCLLQTHANVPPILRVAAGKDQYGEYRGLGVSYIASKVCPLDSNGVLVLENTFHDNSPLRALRTKWTSSHIKGPPDFSMIISKSSLNRLPWPRL